MTITKLLEKKSYLPALGLWVPHSPLVVYHDDGFVDSIEEHSADLILHYYGFSFQDNFKRSKPGARYERHSIQIDPWLPIKIHHPHIFYSDFGSYTSNTLVRAHEETHFLQVTKKLDLLQRAIQQDLGVSIDFNQILNEETIANLGGFYALERRGIEHNIQNNDPEFNEALRIFNEGLA